MPVYRAILTAALAALIFLLPACGDPVGDDQTHGSNAPNHTTTAPTSAVSSPTPFTPSNVAPFVYLALDCAGQEYPNKIGHVMHSDADQGTPRSLHPAFFGCFDWHSSVHGHWLLARFARLYPDHELAAEARAVLADHLTPANVAAETDYLLTDGRASWERPYGLAWLLQLATELHEWAGESNERAAANDAAPDNAAPHATTHTTANPALWSAALQPLEDACVQRITDWLPKLAYPIRTGEHSQTAFAFGLILDYARSTGRTDLADLVVATSGRLYLADRDVDLAFEPSGQDFLSPALAEADLMRRVLQRDDFARWLAHFLPQIPPTDRDWSSTEPNVAATPTYTGGADWLPVALVTDRADGKLAHLDGLNLSRAWMLEGIVAALPDHDPRRPALQAAANAHAQAGLSAVTGEHYAGGHWLGTYAMYLVSGRGLR